MTKQFNWDAIQETKLVNYLESIYECVNGRFDVEDWQVEHDDKLYSFDLEVTIWDDEFRNFELKGAAVFCDELQDWKNLNANQAQEIFDDASYMFTIDDVDGIV